MSYVIDHRGAVERIKKTLGKSRFHTAVINHARQILFGKIKLPRLAGVRITALVVAARAVFDITGNLINLEELQEKVKKIVIPKGKLLPRMGAKRYSELATDQAGLITIDMIKDKRVSPDKSIGIQYTAYALAQQILISAMWRIIAHFPKVGFNDLALVVTRDHGIEADVSSEQFENAVVAHAAYLIDGVAKGEFSTRHNKPDVEIVARQVASNIINQTAASVAKEKGISINVLMADAASVYVPI